MCFCWSTKMRFCTRDADVHHPHVLSAVETEGKVRASGSHTYRILLAGERTSTRRAREAVRTNVLVAPAEGEQPTCGIIQRRQRPAVRVTPCDRCDRCVIGQRKALACVFAVCIPLSQRTPYLICDIIYSKDLHCCCIDCYLLMS